MSELIHYEATAEGLEWEGHDDPIYLGEKDSPVNPTGPQPRGGMKGSNALPRNESQSGEKVDEPTPVCLGPPSLREQCRHLCRKYYKIISTHLNPEPADLPSMELNVDTVKWRVGSNQGPARQQTAVKNIEVRKQIDKLLPIG